jgi:receptor expression-enhancing protein 1/2/3/4
LISLLLCYPYCRLNSCFNFLQEPQQVKQQQLQFQQQPPQKQATPVMRRAASIAARQAAMVQQSQESKPAPSSPKIKRQASVKAGSLASTKSTASASIIKPDESTKKIEVKPAAEQVQTQTTNADSAKSEPSAPSHPEAKGVGKVAIDDAGDTAEGAEEVDPAVEVEETLMEETIRVTRAKLRRRTAAEDSAEN